MPETLYIRSVSNPTLHHAVVKDDHGDVVRCTCLAWHWKHRCRHAAILADITSVEPTPAAPRRNIRTHDS